MTHATQQVQRYGIGGWSGPDTVASDDRRADATTVTVLTAEYTALREEVGRHQDHRNQLFSIALAMMAAVVGLAGAEAHAGKPNMNVSIVFLIAPLLFVFLGGAYIDRMRRMLDAASYIDGWLRSQMQHVIHREVWRWEDFKAMHFGKSAAGARYVAMFFDWLRGLIFVACGFLSLALYADSSGRSYSPGHITLIVVDVVLLFALAAFVWAFEETRGLEKERTSSGQHNRVARRLRREVRAPAPDPPSDRAPILHVAHVLALDGGSPAGGLAVRNGLSAGPRVSCTVAGTRRLHRAEG